MLDLRHVDSDDDASTGDVARALAALTQADLLRLKRLAQQRARLVPGLDWEDLLNDALLRALDGSRRWPRGVPLRAFLAGIMRSLADARARERRQRIERSLAEAGGDSVAAPDAQVHARQCLKAIAAFFAADANPDADRRADPSPSRARRSLSARPQPQAPRRGAQAPRPRDPAG